MTYSLFGVVSLFGVATSGACAMVACLLDKKWAEVFWVCVMAAIAFAMLAHRFGSL